MINKVLFKSNIIYKIWTKTNQVSRFEINIELKWWNLLELETLWLGNPNETQCFGWFLNLQKTITLEVESYKIVKQIQLKKKKKCAFLSKHFLMNTSLGETKGQNIKGDLMNASSLNWRKWLLLLPMSLLNSS